MKKLNLFVMSLLATTAFTFNSCSNDEGLSPGTSQETTDASFYMTLQVNGSNSQATRTVQQEDPNKEDGTTEESNITQGTLYIYQGDNLIYTKKVNASDWATAPTQQTVGVTKPLKVSVRRVNADTDYNVYFLANAQVDAPLATGKAFAMSENGGANYAVDNQFVMFNRNDEKKKADHSTVRFTAANQNENTPAMASEISLDRVVARIDAPTVSTNKVTRINDTKSKNFEDMLEGVSYVSYAVSNLNNNSYVVQKWDKEWLLSTLITGNRPYYKAYDDYGTAYWAKGLSNFTTNQEVAKNYMFENTTNKLNDATSLYFCIKANLTEKAKAKADFSDGTFYRFDDNIFTSIKDIMADEDADGYFGSDATPESVLQSIKGTDGKLIAEGETLAEFRKNHHIDIYREGMMYYRYAINDNFYVNQGFYSVLRNSIYRLNVDAIYDIGRDVPNGPDNPENSQYYMNVTVSINPWVLNATNIQLGK